MSKLVVSKNIVRVFVGCAWIGLVSCSPSSHVAQPTEITASTSCSLDGMLLSDYPGPKAQIHYEQGDTDFFCDTVEMFSIYLKPEQKKKVTGIFVQDMGKADWNNPQGHWIDAKSAFYVVGSQLKGGMGPTLASFSTKSDADSFKEKNGGKVYKFSEITPDMVTLDGGIVNDQHM